MTRTVEHLSFEWTWWTQPFPDSFGVLISPEGDEREAMVSILDSGTGFAATVGRRAVSVTRGRRPSARIRRQSKWAVPDADAERRDGVAESPDQVTAMWRHADDRGVEAGTNATRTPSRWGVDRLNDSSLDGLSCRS